MSKKQVKPHDVFFKHLFSQKEQAMEFLEKTTPPEIVKKLDLNSLQLDTTDYVDDDLKEYFADVVYNCNYKLNEKTNKVIKISFLFEHKSYKEHIPHLQLNKYLLNIWDKQIKQAAKNKTKFNDFRLQPIIPIIFYHGTTKWDKQPFENYFDGTDDFLIRFLPKFDYHLVDMADYPNAKITQLFKKKQLQIGLLLMKNIFYEVQLLDLLKNIFSDTIKFANPTQERQFYQSLTHYIFYALNDNLLNKIIKAMETLQTKQSDNFVSMADRLIMQGIEKGIQEGIQRGMQKGIQKTALSLIQKGFDNQFIEEITGLTNKEIDYLRNLEDNLLD